MAYNKATIFVNKLTLSALSPFVLNAKNLSWKTSGNVVLGHLGEWVFQVFPRLHSILGGEYAPNTF